MKARKIISKGHIYHVVLVRYVEFEVPTFDSVPIVSEFTNVFLNELPGISPKREIDFSIDHLPYTQLVSIPRYRTA